MVTAQRVSHPNFAHGTNPASAVMAGMKVVPVKVTNEATSMSTTSRPDQAHADRLAALTVTYPSTHGVFEASIREIYEAIHAYGLVYMDGATQRLLGCVDRAISVLMFAISTLQDPSAFLTVSN